MKIYKLQTYPATISYIALWKTHCPHPNHSRLFPLQGITHMWNTALFKHFSSQGTYFQTLTLFQTFSSSALSRNHFSPIRHVNVEWRYDSFPPTIFLAFHSVLLNKKTTISERGRFLSCLEAAKVRMRSWGRCTGLQERLEIHGLEYDGKHPV